MSSFSLESFYTSAIVVIQEIIDEAIATDLSSDISYYAWDSRGQETELPNHDLIGLIAWTYAENEGLPVIQFGILTSLVLDQNQFREVRLMDIIRNKFVGKSGDYKTFALYDPNTEEEYSQLQVSDFEVMPAGRSEVRSTRSINIEVIRTTGD